MYCPNCKTVTKSTSYRCEYCKGPLLTTLPHEKAVVKEPEVVPETKVSPVPARSPSSGGLPLGIVLMAVSCILGVIAFFSPFFGIGDLGKSSEMSGFEMTKSVSKLIEVASDSKNDLSGFFGANATAFFKKPDSKSFERILASAIILFILTGPLFFGFFTLQVIFRLFSSSGYGWGLVYAIIYTLVSVIMISIVSSDLKIDFGFFTFVRSGYYMEVVSMGLAALAMMFSDGGSHD